MSAAVRFCAFCGARCNPAHPLCATHYHALPVAHRKALGRALHTPGQKGLADAVRAACDALREPAEPAPEPVRQSPTTKNVIGSRAVLAAIEAHEVPLPSGGSVVISPSGSKRVVLPGGGS